MRYIIGIDLGTTNSCVAYVDTQHIHQSLGVQTFQIPQLSDVSYIESLSTLPSFCYITAPNEFPAGSIQLPWTKQTDFIVGTLALNHGAKVPTRIVQSAKSWLCHSGAGRRDRILPLEGDATLRISPLEATTRYLRHLKDAWNHTIAKGNPEAEFEQQEIVLTVPASFDEVARMLTVEAAKNAGFLNMTLLEEPQAAFYAWIAQHEKNWETYLRPGQTILVVDIGGGTTDFSLIQVAAQGDKTAFQRMAVGDHLLLGGDNMDAAIAHYLENKLPHCTAHQKLQLKHQARKAKEILLSEGSPETYKIVLQGSGSSVIQGSLSLDLTKAELESLLLNGFFGQYPWQEAYQLRKAAGIKTMGLPYEDEPSITKHMAHFLKVSCASCPDFILFNGGAMKPKLFQDSLLQAFGKWFEGKIPTLLPSVNLDLAVSRGAAYYGKVRRGLGVKIGGGTSSGYYLALELKDPSGTSSRQALTLLPRGSEEGASYESDKTFWVLPNTPAAFQLYTSHVRLQDSAGDLVPIDPEEMHALPPIHTVLRFGKKTSQEAAKEKIPVNLFGTLNAIGILEIGLKSQVSNHQWALEFQLKTASGQENSLANLNTQRTDETFDKSYLQKAQECLKDAFSGTKSVKPERLMEQLELLLDQTRREWQPSVLRGLWEALLTQAPHRKCSSEHEMRWWNLAGFFLRPGFGYPMDDFRIKEMWKIILSEAKLPKTQEALIQRWICYRRIAGGLNKGQQMQLSAELMPANPKNKAEEYPYTEKLRAFAAMELIEQPLKIKVGQLILERIKSGKAVKADFWALGRLGARHLLYGTIAHVIGADVVGRWIEMLLQAGVQDEFLLGQLARKTDVREINVDAKVLARVIEGFPGLEALVTAPQTLSSVERDAIFGEQLPLGLSLERV